MPEPLTPSVILQRRRCDPLNDGDVRDNVYAAEELTAFERAMRRLAAQKKPIGAFLIGTGTVLTTLATFYPEKWLLASASLTSVAGGLLVGGGSTSIRSDAYDREKNALLERKGLM